MKKKIISIIVIIFLFGSSAFMLVNYFMGVHGAAESLVESQKQAQAPVEPEVTIKAYFGNKNVNQNSSDCKTVYPVERVIPNDLIIRRRAIEEVLAGPTPAEIDQGYFSSFPNKDEIIAYREKIKEETGESPYEGDEIKIKSVKILSGTAYVVFSSEFKAVMVDQCRLERIKSSLAEAVKQFPKVGAAMIYIEGREGERI